MDQLPDFLLKFLTQLSGGPGQPENNLVRFTLPAIFWAVLLLVAWSRQRHQRLPRERLLLWGFGVGLLRELLLLFATSTHIISASTHDMVCVVLEPLEHALTLASLVMIAGSFLRYILDDTHLARRYLQVGLGAAALGYIASILWWPGQVSINPEARFHQSWAAWAMHLLASGLLATAVVILVKKRGWLRNVVVVALFFLFLGEFLLLVNFWTNWQYNYVLCPIGNTFHIWAVPLFGLVYFREQSIEKQQAEEALRQYRDHLEELVEDRTAELTTTNEQLQREVGERMQAEAQIAQRNAQLAAQNAIAGTISQSLDLTTILDAALEKALDVLEMKSGCIFLLDPDDGSLAMQVSQGRTSPCDWVEGNRPECRCKQISERVVTDLEPVVIRVADQPDEWQCPLAVEDDLRLLIGIPLVTQGRAVGALTLGTQRQDAIPAQEIKLLTAIGQQIGVAVENAHLYRETQRWAEGMALLHDLSVSLSTTLDPAEIYHQITQQSAELTDCPVTMFFRWNPEHQEAVEVSRYGVDGPRPRRRRLRLADNALLSELITQRRAITVDDAEEDPRIPGILREGSAPRSLLCLPVWGTSEPLGFLLLIDPHTERHWQPHEIDLLESFIDRAAAALENAHLHKQLEWAAALEERQRIAAELHDGLAQTLSYLGIKTDRVTELLQEGQKEQVFDECYQMQAAIGRATRDVRRSIATLQESPRPRRSLQEALGQTILECTEEGDPPMDVRIHSQDPLFLPAHEMEQVLRVVREALLNARRHARARQITVGMERLPDAVEVTVEDDGQGFDPEGAPTDGDDHFGLSIMRARAARIAGQVQVDSQPGQGTRVRLTWPLTSERESPVLASA